MRVARAAAGPRSQPRVRVRPSVAVRAVRGCFLVALATLVCAFVCAFVSAFVCSFRGLFAYVLSWVEILRKSLVQR